MIGLEAPGPGNANFQAMFSFGPHCVGNSAESVVIPEPFGPLKRGQSAWQTPLHKKPTARMINAALRMHRGYKTVFMLWQLSRECGEQAAEAEKYLTLYLHSLNESNTLCRHPWEFVSLLSRKLITIST
ncbi:hypothetical protein N9239_00590 [bacterium]|nr:hypothetical protein [bacterium]